MFDIYESIIRCEELTESIHLREKFGAWCLLNNKGAITNKEKLEFLEEIVQGEGNLIDRIIDFEEEKGLLVKFFMVDVNALHIELVTYDMDKEKEAMFHSIWTEEKLANVLGVSLSPQEKKILVHASYYMNKEVKFYYFKKSGILFVADINRKESSVCNIQQEEVQLNLFRAFSDEKRYLMIKELSKGDRTASELSKICQISLSTVNHHMKLLIEQRLVLLSVSTNSGRGAIYTLNKLNIREILSDFMNEYL